MTKTRITKVKSIAHKEIIMTITMAEIMTTTTIMKIVTIILMTMAIVYKFKKVKIEQKSLK